MNWFMKFISTKSFMPFVYYRVALGIVIIVLVAAGVLSRTPRSRRADAPRPPLTALAQQLARVAPAHLERCRASALDSPDAAPGRSTGADAGLIALLDRAISGGPGGDTGFLDLGGLLTNLSAAGQDAAAARGFGGGSNGDALLTYRPTDRRVSTSTPPRIP
ncbi:hypothetical protein ADK35_24165 [Streptomyces viridochromogenes]|nr:hypothetical protein ADK36_26685 [Streptomyces viridochromogenes]KOG17312.1 hypothetical protein ADK35_24165 [Streptomyces viridochromogenes]